MKDKEMRALNHRYADAPMEQCVHIGFGQLADSPVEKFYYVVAGVVVRQPVIGHKQIVTKAVLLAKNYGLFVYAQRCIHLGIRYDCLAQTAVEKFFARRLGMQFIAQSR